MSGLTFSDTSVVVLGLNDEILEAKVPLGGRDRRVLVDADGLGGKDDGWKEWTRREGGTGQLEFLLPSSFVELFLNSQRACEIKSMVSYGVY